MLPLWFSIIFWTIANPRPEPPVSVWRAKIFSLWGFYVSLAGAVCFVAGIKLIRTAEWLAFEIKNQDQSMTIGPEGVTQQTPGIRTTFRWARFVSYAETDSLLVLRQGSAAGIVIPKRLFDEHDLPAIRKLLAERLTLPVPSLTHGFEVHPS